MIVRLLRQPFRLLLCLPLLFLGLNAGAQANLPFYTSWLVNGFWNSSWATVNFSAVYGGSNCVSVINDGDWQALYFGHLDFNTSPYNALDFWINGGSGGGQRLQVAGATNGEAPVYYFITLQTNVWQHYTIPLSSLEMTAVTNCTGFWFQGRTNGLLPVFYVCNVQLLAAPAPSTVHLNVDAANVLRTADTRWFGLNTATWDGELDTAATSNLLAEIGCTTLRFPGGSFSDIYHWETDTRIGNIYPQAVAFTNFIPIATNLGAQVFITVNYGTGTSNEAAAWVACANITNHCNFKYWEIGNEVYDVGEPDSNSAPNDPYTYATLSAGYIQLMKAADPAIKIGAVAVAGEDNDVNYTTHAATNPVTGLVHYGWTPVMLATFQSLGVYPDFLIYHGYPEWTFAGSNSIDSDPMLLQVEDNYNPAGLTDWASTAQNLRMQLTDYLGSEGSNIELCVTENNSTGGTLGKQSTSIVNALYLADSLGQLMRTEFNSLIWWDLRDALDYSGDFDPTLYGWRPYGYLGITLGTTNFPVFYAKKLLQSFAGAGDSVVGASSDYLLLSAYAVHRTNGALTMLVINKDTTTNFNARIALTNFVPWTNATIQSYGIPQDQAAENNESISLQDIATTNFPAAGTNFTYSFPALSLTLFTFAPAAPQLQSSSTSNGRIVLQVQGQAGVPYVMQTSTNLINWTSVSTNTLAGNVLNLTNTVSSGPARQFWRAVWQP